MNCIFVDQPKECSLCLDSRKLQCLLNKQHLKVKSGAKKELIMLLRANMSGRDRYKVKSGQEGRIGNENTSTKDS